MSDPRAAAAAVSPGAAPASHPTGGWPGGWYVYENGKVAGPYTAEHAFALDATTAEGKPRMVSRKGFSQWYALKDLSEIFRITGDLGKRASAELQAAQEALARAKALHPDSPRLGEASKPMLQQGTSRSAMSPSFPTPSSAQADAAASPQESAAASPVVTTTPSALTGSAPLPASAGPTTPPPSKEPALQKEATAPLAANTATSAEAAAIAAIPYAPPLSRVQQRKLNTKASASWAKPQPSSANGPAAGKSAHSAPKPAAATKVTASAAANIRNNPAKDEKTRKSKAASNDAPAAPSALHRHAPKSAKAAAAAALMHEYFIQRPRLHLGKLRNAWMSAFVGLPLSAGLYWAFWYGELAREIDAHSQNAKPLPMSYAVLALLPGLHLVMTFVLARRLVSMEAQNRYRTVSPALASVLALFPPFAMAYLQEAANRHWMLHARHALAKRAEATSDAAS